MSLSNFLNLPGEIRNMIYEFLFVLDAPIEAHMHRALEIQRRLTIAGTSKTIYREASSLFYSQNRFAFGSCGAECIVRFLDKIGRTNASYIRDICVPTPLIRYYEEGNSFLEENDNRTLAKIRSDCTNLKVLRTGLDNTNYRDFVPREPDSTDGVLELMTSRFRSIASLHEIVGEVYESDPSVKDIMQDMENHGWTVHVLDGYKYESDSSELDCGDYSVDSESE